MHIALGRFSETQWEPGAHPLEQKKVCADGKMVMLRFAAGFEDPNWCTRGHCLCVRTGVLRLILRDEVHVVTAGDAIVVTEGTEHRAANGGSGTLELLAVQYAAIEPGATRAE